MPNYETKFVNIITTIHAFDDMMDQFKSLSSKEKGLYFEWFAQLFFKFDPRYADFIDECWLISEIPQKVLEHLNIIQDDIGIDMIIKSNDEYWSVQMKYRQNIDEIIPWKCLSTFYGQTFGLTDKKYIGASFSLTHAIIVTYYDTVQHI